MTSVSALPSHNNATRIVKALAGYTYRFTTEVDLHEAIASVLTREQIEFQREVVAGPEDRFDFLIEPGLVLEVKVHGSLSKSLPQVQRYALRDDVHAVILASSRAWDNPLGSDRMIVAGKFVHLVRIRAPSF